MDKMRITHKMFPGSSQLKYVDRNYRQCQLWRRQSLYTAPPPAVLHCSRRSLGLNPQTHFHVQRFCFKLFRQFSLNYRNSDISIKKPVILLDQMSYISNSETNDNSLKRAEGRDRLEAEDPRLKLRFTEVISGIGVWDDRPQGCYFNVSYIDTDSGTEYELKKDKPIVLAIHGAPGKHTDLLQLAKPLVEKGFRVIIPNMPGYGLTKGRTSEDDHYFGQTNEERAEFIYSFMQRLNIRKVDVAVGHSAGCYPLTALCTLLPSIKSVVFISPGPGHAPCRVMRPTWLIKLVASWWDSKLTKPLAWVMLKYGAMRRFRNMELQCVANSALMTAAIDYYKMPVLAQEFEIKKYPLLYIYGTKDRFIEQHLSEQYADYFGVLQDKIAIYNQDGQVKYEGSPCVGHYARGVQLEGGSHQPLEQEQFKHIIMQEIVKLHDCVKSM